MHLPEELRHEAQWMAKTANAISDPNLRAKLLHGVVELSQRAELLESEMFDPELLNRNIARYRTMLTRDISEDHRRLIRVTLSDAETLAENRLLVRDTSDLGKLKVTKPVRWAVEQWFTHHGDRTSRSPINMFPFDRRTDEEFVSIVDVMPDSRRFRYRSVSRLLSQRLGYQMTGKCVDDIPDERTRRYVSQLYSTALDNDLPLYERSKRFFNNRSWNHEVLALPMSSNGKSLNMLMIFRKTYGPKLLGTVPSGTDSVARGASR
jgi:hypothetical protein